MAVRAPRLLSAVTAAGVMVGSLLVGAGVAQASPVPQPPGGGTVAATCGQTVSAYPGDQVLVTPTIGPAFTQSVLPGTTTVSQTIAGLLCSVQVNVLVPVQGQLQQIAPPLAQLTAPVTEGAGQMLAPQPQAPAQAEAPQQLVPAAPVPAQAPANAPVTELPAAAPAPALSPDQLAANAPLFAPSFTSELPSSFLASAAPAPGLASYGAPSGSLFGSAFPGLSAGAPGGVGTTGSAATDAVTTASQVQALPVEGLSGGVGLPAILAVLAASGAAALAVRRLVLGRTLLPAALGAGAPPAPPAATDDAGTPAAETPAETPAETTTVVARLDGAPASVEDTSLMEPVSR